MFTYLECVKTLKEIGNVSASISAYESLPKKVKLSKEDKPQSLKTLTNYLRAK